MEKVGYLPKRDEVVLDVLARGEVGSSAAELVGNAGKLAGLARGDHAARDLRPHHVNIRLPLAVNAAPEPDSAKLIVGQLASKEGFGLGPKQLDVVPYGGIVLALRGGLHTNPSILYRE